MLLVILDTRFISYNNKDLKALCKDVKPFAYCKFLPYYSDPQCNVPLNCFNREFWNITDEQEVFYLRALSIIRTYNAAEKKCLSYNLPWSLFEIVVEAITYSDTEFGYCSPNYYVSIMLDQDMLRNISPLDYGKYALIDAPPNLIGITNVSDDNLL
jgi:hypothetical protein